MGIKELETKDNKDEKSEVFLQSFGAYGFSTARKFSDLSNTQFRLRDALWNSNPIKINFIKVASYNLLIAKEQSAHCRETRDKVSLK